MKRSSIKNIKQKVLKKEEMEELLDEVGFIIEKVYGDFDKGKYLQSSPALIIIAMERIAEILDTAGAVFRKSNTLFIDEGDLGTLDDDVARKRFFDKILELEKMFKKIILITHLEDVAEQFPNCIKIGRDNNGKSKIFY